MEVLKLSIAFNVETSEFIIYNFTDVEVYRTTSTENLSCFVQGYADGCVEGYFTDCRKNVE